MNAEQLEKIEQLSIVNNRIGIIAKHILEEISGVPYEEPLEEINTATIENYKETSEINKIEGIQIYPHPVGSQSILQISLAQTNNNTKCFIYNLFGQEMLTFDLFNEHNNININNNMLPSGVFIAVIYDGNKFVDSFKFIVGE